MEREEIERRLDRNLSDFLESKLPDVDCTKIHLHRSDKFMDLLDKLGLQIRHETTEFIKARIDSIINEKAVEIEQEARSWVK